MRGDEGREAAQRHPSPHWSSSPSTPRPGRATAILPADEISIISSHCFSFSSSFFFNFL